MILRTPSTTRSDTLFPYTMLVRVRWDRRGDHYLLACVLHLRLADLEGRGLCREREEGVVEHLAQRVRRDVADHADEEAVAPETLRDDAAQILDGDARDGGFSAAGRPGVDMLAIHQPAQHVPGDVVGNFWLARKAGDDLAAEERKSTSLN